MSIDFRPIALDAVTELRNQMCRRGPHDMTPKEMLACPRCSAILRFEAAVKRAEAERAIVQTPQGAAEVALREKADQAGERHD